MTPIDTPIPPAYWLALGFAAGFLAAVALERLIHWLELRRISKDKRVTIAPAVLHEARFNRPTLPYRVPAATVHQGARLRAFQPSSVAGLAPDRTSK